MITKYQDPVLQQLLNHIPALTGRTIVDQENLYHAGAIAGSEFETYAVTKLYLAVKMDLSATASLPVAFTGNVGFYDFSDALVLTAVDKTVSLDTDGTGFVVCYNHMSLEKILFSRMLRSGQYSNMMFIGMRISLSP